MKFQNINVQNYGSFEGEHEFALDGRGLTLILGDNQDEPRMNSNGSGKSTLFDALDWCLWGKVPRDDHADSVINDRVGRDCEVTVSLEDEAGRPVMIRRYRKIGGKESGLMFLVDAKELTALDAKETQARIEQFLGMDRTVFHATVLFAQTDLFDFADATDKERSEILTKILQLDDIDRWLEKTKGKRKDAERMLLENETKLSRLEGEKGSLESLDFEKQINEWEIGQKQKLDNIDGRAREVQAFIDRTGLDSGVEQTLREHIARIGIPTAEDGSGAVQQIDADLNALNIDMMAQRGKLGASQSDLNRVVHDLAHYMEKGEGACGECGQYVTGAHLQAEITRLQAERANHDHAIAALGTLLGQSQEQHAALTQKRGELQHAANEKLQAQFQELDGYKSQLATIEANKAAVERAQMDIRSLDIERSMAKDATNPFLEKQKEVRDRVFTLGREVANVRKSVTELQERIEYLTYWVEGFSPKGLKSYVLDSRLQEMSDAANEWVRLLTGGTIWVRFETQTKGRSTGKLSNKFNIRVFRYNPDGSVSERNFRSWSGGEKQRVSFGIDFGLTRLIAARATKTYDLLILDEVFKHLDQAGRESVVEMLQRLKQEKSTIFVIDHDSEFQGAFENRVVIRKQNGRSQIVEMDSGKPEEKPKAKKRRRSVPNRTPVRVGKSGSAAAST